MRAPVMVHRHLEFELSGPACDLWISGGLHDEFGIPEDGRYRVEIIGGEVVVSAVPPVAHAGIIADIRDAFSMALATRPGFPRRVFEDGDVGVR